MDADVKSFDPIAASQNLKAGFIDSTLQTRFIKSHSARNWKKMVF